MSQDENVPFLLLVLVMR